MQYGASLVMCLACLPFQPHRVELTVALVVTLLWLAIVISVIAQLLLYRLIHTGNLVNVTSLFYLVPIVTAVMDRWIFDNALSSSAVGGMAAILTGLAVARSSRCSDWTRQPRPPRTRSPRSSSGRR